MSAEEFNRYGYFFEKNKKGMIVAVSHNGRRIKHGQSVVSNGRLVAYGRKGKVIKISSFLYKRGMTSDLLRVRFEGEACSYNMKFKDLK